MLTHAEFEKVLEHVLNRKAELCQRKGKEYSTTDNRLQNFDEASHLLKAIYKIIPYDADNYDALIGMMIKQLVSVFDIIRDLKNGKQVPPKLIDEKAGDIDVYFTLLEAMMREHSLTLPARSDNE